MSAFVAFLVIASIMSVSGAAIGALATIFSRQIKPNPLEQVYWSFTFWAYGLGAVLIVAPDWWFGPSWHYFKNIPHNGMWMGWVLVTLAAVFTLVLLRPSARRSRRIALMLYLIGFVYWTAGFILAAEGLAGREGLMEAPFMMYAGAHLFVHSAATMAQRRVDATPGKGQGAPDDI